VTALGAMTPLPLAGWAADLWDWFNPGEFTFGWVVGRILLVLLVVHSLIITGAVMVWLERRVCAWMQGRIGPNRVGPQGLLQPIADLLKFLFKEDVVPGHVNKWMYTIAPAVLLIPAMVTFAVIPFTGNYSAEQGTWTSWQLADLDIGVLYVLAVASLGVYGITLGGWASNSKYALLGGVRSSAQMISYELSLGLSLIPLVLIVGSLRPSDLVAHQAHTTWFVFQQPLAFFIFLVASYAETNRLPFDLPEAETELVAGYHTEYSSMKFALFFLAEYVNMAVGSALVVTAFLGGWTLFGLEKAGWFMGTLIFAAKVFTLLFVFIWVRWTLPRFRYDQLMAIGWGWFLPIAVWNVILTAAGAALGAPWVAWILPVLLLGSGIGAVWLAWSRDRRRDASNAPAEAAR
jgi:NADH-quinone oxidoreductase subunit H